MMMRWTGNRAAMALARWGAGIDLIHLDHAGQHRVAIGHHRSDAAQKVPGEFASDPEHLAELARAAMPFDEAAISQMARIHWPGGRRVRCMAVPLVSEHCERQLPQM